MGKAHMSTTATIRRYVGGTRNIDGRVTATFGVYATSPDDAKQRLAERFNARLNGRVRNVDDIGIVRSYDVNVPINVTTADVDGDHYNGSAVIPEASTLFSWDIRRTQQRLRDHGLIHPDATVTARAERAGARGVVIIAEWTVTA